ncbi:MAG TPA: ABC transporter ATP-binding protein [Amycolatopsis sp.]|nr:ABC transporter ATP-binding protein [Amycolatopsis sp.]
MIGTQQLGVAIGDDWLFRSLDLFVDGGECLAVTGKNGSGKSTLLGCLYGTRTPSEGSVTVGGDVPDERSLGFRRRVSVLLEDSALFDELSPRQHLDLLRAFPGSRPEPDDLLAWASLDHRADVPAGHLSAGQRRRLLLLGCIARPHEVLLLDEPERALDAVGRAWLTELVRGSLTAGAAVVLATHHRRLVDAAATAEVELS